MTHITRPKTLAMVLFHLLLYFCSFFSTSRLLPLLAVLSFVLATSAGERLIARLAHWSRTCRRFSRGGERQYENMETCCRFFAQRKIEHVSCSRKAKLNGSPSPLSLSWAHIKHILVLLRCPWKLTLIRHWVVGIGVVVAGSWHLSMIATSNWMSSR